MVLSIIVYGFIMATMFFLSRRSIFDVGHRKFYYSLAILIYTIFCGLRFDVGVDYLSYLNDFKYVDSQIDLGKSICDIHTRFEPLYMLSVYFLLKIGLGYPFIFGFFAFLQIFCIYYTLRSFPRVLPFIGFTLIAFGDFFMLMNGIRQMVAFSILILSIRFTFEHKYIKSLVVSLIAVGFHYSAIIFIPFCIASSFVKNLKVNAFLQLAIYISAFFLSQTVFINGLGKIISLVMSNLGDFGDRYSDVKEILSYNKSIRFGGRAAITLIMNTMVILYSKQLLAENKNTIFVPLYLLYYIGIILYQIFITNHHIIRFVQFFSTISFIIYAFFLAYLTANRNKNNSIILYASVSLGILYLLIALFADDGSASLLYKFYGSFS